MARVEVPSARATIDDTPDGLVVTIPARRKWSMILFLPFWLIVWAIAEFGVTYHLFSAKSPMTTNLFLAVWLGGWTAGGGLAAYAWLWSVFGKEVIVLGQTNFKTKRAIAGFGPAREYDLADMKNLRIDRRPVSPYNFATAELFGGGKIAFDYGAKTFGFAAGVDEAEARELIRRFKSRHRFAEADAE